MSSVGDRVGSVARAWSRDDLALAPDDRPVFLPWIVAIMTFLATLALAAALSLAGAAGRWTADMTGTVTVEIAAESAGDPRPPEQRREAVLAVLRDTAGIARATPLGADRIVAMLEPWLGAAAGAADLPLPQIIDVALAPGARLDLPALGQRLEAAAPGTVVDDHRRWLGGLLRLARLAVALGLVIVVLVGCAASGTVVFATRAGLAAHHEAIELLHLMGARDAYIARQFARLVLWRSAAGALGGLIVGLAAFYGLAGAAQANLAVESGAPSFFSGPWLGLGDFALLGLLVVATIAVATLTAWWTVMRALRNMV
jgi:cell division transport system permease protein